MKPKHRSGFYLTFSWYYSWACRQSFFFFLRLHEDEALEFTLTDWRVCVNSKLSVAIQETFTLLLFVWLLFFENGNFLGVFD